jgi:hypothetical protein
MAEITKELKIVIIVFMIKLALLLDGIDLFEGDNQKKPV